MPRPHKKDELEEALDKELMLLSEKKTGKNKAAGAAATGAAAGSGGSTAAASAASASPVSRAPSSSASSSASPKTKPKKKRRKGFAGLVDDGDDDADDDFNADDEEGELEEMARRQAEKEKEREERERDKQKAIVPLKKRKGSAAMVARDDAGGGTAGDSSDEDFNDGYAQDLMGGAEDRRAMAAMSEMDRERISTERYERRKALQERWEAKRKMKRSAQDKASSGGRPALRDRTKTGSKAEAMSELKAARREGHVLTAEEKQARVHAATARYVSTRRTGKTGGDDDDDASWHSEEGQLASDDDDDRERDDGWHPSSRAREAAGAQVLGRESGQDEATLEDLRGAWLSRAQLAKWASEPFFAKVAPGFFVRVGIGTHDGQQVYRLCEVVEVRNGTRRYRLGDKDTYAVLRARHGAAEKDFRMEIMSNTPPTEDEYNRWRLELRRRQLPPPTRSDAAALRRRLEQYRNYIYTEEEIQKLVAQRNAARARPVSLARERARLVVVRDAASSADAKDEVERLTARIEELDAQAEVEAVVDRKRVETVDRINAKNWQKNLEVSAARGPKTDHELRAASLDPFSRRPTAPAPIFVASIAASAPAPKKDEAPPPPPSAQRPPSLRGSFDANAAVGDDDEPQLRPRRLVGVEEIDLNIDLVGDDTTAGAAPAALRPRPVPAPAVAAAPPPSSSQHDDGTNTSAKPAASAASAEAKTLSLEEYKRRRGII